jgi:hypothetical protein
MPETETRHFSIWLRLLLNAKKLFLLLGMFFLSQSSTFVKREGKKNKLLLHRRVNFFSLLVIKYVRYLSFI